MALTVKGFVEIPSFINNIENQTAAVGELGRQARTFSRDRQRFQDANKDASELVIFSCKDGATKALMPNSVKDMCLDIMEEAYNNFITSKTFEEQLTDAFPTLTNVQTGADIVHSGRALVNWFSFEFTDGGNLISVKLWLSNASFVAEYDEYELHVVAPSSNIEEYHLTYADAQNTKAAFTLSVRNAAERAVIAGSPPTDIRIVELNWVDPSDSANTLLTEWSLVGYGPQAFIYENMIEAIREYLTDNSSHDITSWVQYFPELNNIDVIYLFPQWENVALTSSPTPGQGDNLYATYFKYKKGVDNLRKILTGTTLTQMRDYIEIITSIQKSIAIATVGKESNRVGAQVFSDQFPDYSVFNINTSNNGLLSSTTEGFVTLLSQLLAQAEQDDGSSPLPAGMVRQTTGGATFIESVYNGVTFRLCTKATYLPFT